MKRFATRGQGVSTHFSVWTSALGHPLSRLLALIAMTLTLVAIAPSVQAQTVDGTIYRDFNANATQDAGDPGVAGVTVTAYDASGGSASDVTDANGDYSIDVSALSGTDFRLEVTGVASYLSPGAYGASSGTTVLFASANDTGVDMGLNNPNDYCQSNPDISLPCYENGSASGSSGPSVISFPYNATGLNSNYSNFNGTPGTGPVPNKDGEIQEVGAVWGVAWEADQERAFSSAFMKRHVGFADGPGYIYVIDYTSSPGSVVHEFDLQGVAPANGGAAIDLGSVCRQDATDGDPNPNCDPQSTGLASDYTLPIGSNTTPNVDLDAFGKVGRMSYGDMNMQEDASYLWVVNLFQRALIRIDVSGASASLPGQVDQYPLSSLANWPTAGCTAAQGELRPFGLNFNDGRGYLGVVCDASASQAVADLHAWVLSFDPNNIAAGFTSEVDFGLDYTRVWWGPDPWYDLNPWLNTWADMAPFEDNNFLNHPQPMLSDIEFDGDGNMYLDIGDRTGHQLGYFNYRPISGTFDTNFRGNSRGDIIKVCTSSGGWIIEGSAGCAIPNDYTDSDGVGGDREFFEDQSGDGGEESAQGAWAILKGNGQIVSTVFDPHPSGSTGSDYWDTQGVQTFSLTDGGIVNWYSINYGTIETFGKASGTGDIELLCDRAPLEVGNRVWMDTDEDGIQDPGEMGLDGVDVTLTCGAETATVTTAGGGLYLFKDGQGDIASWTNGAGSLDDGIIPRGAACTLTISASDPDLSGKVVTDADQGGAGAGSDLRDSDGTESGGNVSVSFNTGGSGDNDHTYDFGFKSPPSFASLGDKVWEDLDGDGIQDAGEPGVDGVTVTLYACSDKTTALGSTVTAGGGMYSFTNLTPGDYCVIFSNLPAGFVFTSQDQGGDDAADSDADPSTGESHCVTLASGDNNTTVDAGIYEPASLGDKVWNDLDQDGVQDAGEPGVDGVTVTLYACSDKTTALGSTVTAGGGMYSFTGLAPGDYCVIFSNLPAGFQFTGQDAGGDDTLDSDADPSDGESHCVTLASGDNDPTVDAGIYAPASLGDKVWEDLDGDGIQDAGEPGVDGVTVTLYACSDKTTALGSTVTAGGGMYSFTGLTPGDYCVVFSNLPAGFVFTSQDQGSDDAADSDADPSTGESHCVTLASGDNDPTIDAGIYEPASLGDLVWEDLDQDGIQDAGEPGVDGVTVTLYACSDKTTALGSTVTAGGGMYSFTGLAPGDYCVVFSNLPAGYVFSPQDAGGDDSADSDANPMSGESHCVTLASGDNDPTVDAGIYQTPKASLGNKVWEDLDGDGIQDPGEPGIDGVTVTLYACSDKTTALASMVTSAGGMYLFSNLDPGDYCVVFSNLPAGFVFTSQDQGGDDAADSDADPSTGESHCVTLASGDNDTTVDAGIYEPASLGDLVWEDLDEDGIQDAGEPGVDGVTVTLYACSDKTTALGSTVTAGGGMYSFTGLAPGDYCVIFSNLPAGYVFSPQDAGGDDSADSDANPMTGESHCVTLASGDNDPTVDAGIYEPAAPPASLGDKVWEDLDGDGIQDPGEPGIDGVTVTLYACTDKNTPLASMVTSGGGMYLFSNLAAGDYCIEVTLPVGYAFSPQNQGNDETVDSDVNNMGTSDCVTLAAGEDHVDLDAGIFELKASLGNKVFEDLDGDGIQDPGESGIDGVTVTLYSCTDKNTALASTVTSGGGMYQFTGLDAGDYCVVFSNFPAGYTLSPQDQGGDDSADSDADATGQSPCITLAPGEFNDTVDAGLVPPAPSGDADLCVTKVVNDAMPMVGEQVTFTIFAINNGPNDASNVTVLDLLPNGLSYDSHAASKGSYDTNTGVWDIGTLANGESATLTITATVTESGSHQNCATIACPQDDPNPDNNHSCATVNTEGSSGGGGAGVESQASEEMAVLFARRLFSRTMAQDESIAKRDAIELPALEASTVNSHVDGAGHLASVISALVPEQLQAASATGLVSTPTDLLGYTNATAVFAADYVRSDSRRAAALFATSTPAGQLYDHTKLICDRFGGGIYEGFERVSVAGHSFILAKMIQPSGEVDYAIELAVYNTGSGFEVENRFSWGEYTPRGSGEVMNFQIWGAVPAYTIALAEEVLANLGQLGQVSYQAEAAELPSVFVRTARYDQGRMWLELVNRDGADQVRISGRLQATELGGLEQPFDQTISLDPSQETREVELVTGPVFSAILEVETSQRAARDRLYQADGAWSYASDANSQISGFSVQPQTGFVDGDLVYERRARLSGRVAEGGWVSLFRQVRPAGQSADWRSYRTLEFEARGSGEVILQIHESGQSDAYQTRIVLSPVMQRYAISFSELRRAGGVTGGFVGASVEAVAFYPVGSGVFDMEVEGLRLRYDSTVPVEPGEVPSAYLLDQNYPNPFNPETQIRFGLPESSEVKLSVYDVLGREVAILAEGRLSAGVHVVTFGATGLPSGTYIYRLETPTQTLTQKMTLLK